MKRFILKALLFVGLFFVTTPVMASDIEEIIVVGAKESIGYSQPEYDNSVMEGLDSTKIYNWEIEHLDTKHCDLEYIYYIWQKPASEAWISIFEVQPFVDQIGECIFVGRADKLIGKYKQNTNYDG